MECGVRILLRQALWMKVISLLPPHSSLLENHRRRPHPRCRLRCSRPSSRSRPRLLRPLPPLSIIHYPLSIITRPLFRLPESSLRPRRSYRHPRQSSHMNMKTRRMMLAVLLTVLANSPSTSSNNQGTSSMLVPLLHSLHRRFSRYRHRRCCRPGVRARSSAASSSGSASPCHRRCGLRSRPDSRTRTRTPP